jgi:hypothetical protein
MASKIKSPGTLKLDPERAHEPADDRSFSPDRREEDSAGAKGKERKKAVAAERKTSSR